MNERQKAKDLIALALDARNNSEKECAAAAFQALKLIDKYDLLDSPLDGLLGGFRGSDNATVKAVSNIVRRFTEPDAINDFKTVAGRGKGRRRAKQ
jgi:hypothetical protein